MLSLYNIDCLFVKTNITFGYFEVLFLYNFGMSKNFIFLPLIYICIEFCIQLY